MRMPSLVSSGSAEVKTCASLVYPRCLTHNFTIGILANVIGITNNNIGSDNESSENISKLICDPKREWAVVVQESQKLRYNISIYPNLS